MSLLLILITMAILMFYLLRGMMTRSQYTKIILMLLFPQFHLSLRALVMVLIRLVMSFQSPSIGVNQPLLQVRQNLNWKQVLPINMLPTVQVREVHRLFSTTPLPPMILHRTLIIIPLQP